MQPKDFLFNNVSRETFEKISQYVDMVVFWNKSINLIASSTIDEVWQRHIFDSFQLAQHMPFVKTILDIGSGGGFPAIMIAICFPESKIIMIESDKRKAIFLNEVIRKLELDNAKVINGRSEKLQSLNVDIITARACAQLDHLFKISAKHLREAGEMWLLKGKTIHDEITLAKDWFFDYELFENKSSNGYMVCIRSLRNNKNEG